jgi:hypothetical protein
MDNTVAPVNASYNATASAAYTSNIGAVSTYEELLNLEEDNFTLDGASSASGSSVDAGVGSADLLNLSPEALALLNGISSGSGSAQAQAGGIFGTDLYGFTSPLPANATSLTEIIAAYNSASGASSASGSASSPYANLTFAQQQQVATIVSQYASAPLTPATVAKINSALTNAGINPQQLSLQEIYLAYAAFIPTQGYSDAVANSTLSDELLDA